jgi:hypothetical protein
VKFLTRLETNLVGDFLSEARLIRVNLLLRWRPGEICIKMQNRENLTAISTASGSPIEKLPAYFPEENNI